jgi:hypothetical protein
MKRGMRGLVPPLLAVLLSLASSIAGLAQPARERFLRDWLVEGHGEEVLFRPVDILVTNGCQVWVADAGNARIYRWGCDGRVLPALGRKGEGPGEFGQPSVLEALGRDTVAVWDRPTQRMTLYSQSGRLLGSRRISLVAGEHGFVNTLGSAGSHTLVATDNYPGGPRRPVEDFSFVWVADAAGHVDRPLLRLPGPQFGGAEDRLRHRASGRSVRTLTRVPVPERGRHTPSGEHRFQPNRSLPVGGPSARRRRFRLGDPTRRDLAGREDPMGGLCPFQASGRA